MRFTLTLIALPVLLGACATVANVGSAAPDAGKHRVFQAPMADLIPATQGALAGLNFGVKTTAIEGDSAWSIIASKGMSFWSYGEVVRVRLARIDSGQTAAWVHTKRRLATNVFAEGDWSVRLFVAMQAELDRPRLADARVTESAATH